MVSVRKRKMNRSGVAKNRQRNNNKSKYNPKSNPIIAQHWNNELTAKQNYKKLGLTFRIGSSTGGEEKKIKIKKIHHDNMNESLFDEDPKKQKNNDKENNQEFDEYDPANILEGTAKFLKDDNGNILKIIYGTKKLTNKTQDIESEIEQESEPEDNSEAKEVIAKLEAIAAIPKKKEIHYLNEVEVSRCAKLIAKYGDDYDKMMWDKKLNPFQLSPGQLRKQIAKYKELHL